MSLSKREILFVLKMQNQSRQAIGEFKNELVQAASAMQALDGSATRLGKQRGPKGVTDELIKAQQEAAKTVQKLVDIETILRDLDDKRINMFDGTGYGEALKVFKEMGANRENLGEGSAEEVNLLMEHRRRAIEQLGPAYDAMGDAAKRAGDKAESGLEDANDALDEHNRRVSGATKAWRLAKLAIAGVTAFLGGSKIIREADAWKSLTGQLRLVTTSEENLLAVREAIIDVANETYSDLGATAGLYSKLAQRADQLGRSQESLIDLTRNFSMAMQIGGASSEEAAAATRQFTQAVSAGTLRGDELNSIIENGAGLAMAFEDGLRAMGNEVTSLKNYIQEANPTIRELLEALDTQTDDIREKFEKLPLTVRQGMQVFSNSFTEFIGKVDESSKATDGLATFFVRLGNILRDPAFIDTVAGLANIIGGVLNAALSTIIGLLDFFRNNTWAAAIAAGVLTTYLTNLTLLKLGSWLKTATSGIRAATKATWLWTASLMANPIVALAAIIMGVVAALYVFRNEIKFGGEEAYTLAEVARGAFMQIKLVILQVADFFKALWSDNIDSVKENFGEFAGFLAEVFRWIVDLVKTTIDTYIGLWVFAYKSITVLWEGLPKAIGDVVMQAVNWTIDGINDLLKSATNGINSFLGLVGDIVGKDLGQFEAPQLERIANEYAGAAEALGDAFGKAKDESFISYVDAAGNAVGGLIDKLGAMGRMQGDEEGSLNTDSNDPGDQNNKDDKDAAKAAAERKKAMEALQKRIEDTKVATAQQLRMNDAIRQGPAAVRDLNAQLAYEVELRDALEGLKEAGVSTAEGSAGRALAEASAIAAKNAELAKQSEELANLSYALDDNIKKMREEAEVAQRGFAIAFEQDVLRQRQLSWTETYNAKLKELTRGYEDAGWELERYTEEMREAEAAARDFANSQRALQNSSIALGLLDSMKTDAERAADNFRLSEVAVAEFLRTAEGLDLPARDIERIKEGLERIRPPENVFDSLKMGLRDFMDEIRPSFQQVRELGAQAFGKIGDSLADLVLTGKANFGELARSIIADLTRMIIKALLFKAISSMFGLGSSANPFSNLTVVGADGPGLLSTFSLDHTGGIAGAGGASRKMYVDAFANAKKYHSGGLAGHKSLPGEIPVIAKRNEAILPTKRLPDGNFGVKADMGGVGGGSSVFAPTYQLNFNGSSNGGRTPADLDPETQKRFGAMLEEELEIHTQRKFEEWTRPGGALYMAMKRR